MTAREIARFLRRFDMGAQDECWLWRGITPQNRYGRISLGGKNVGAHRASYLYFIGEIPPGTEVCHSCDTPGCVNPNHLWLGTHAENMADIRAEKNYSVEDYLQRQARLKEEYERHSAKSLGRSEESQLRHVRRLEIQKLTPDEQRKRRQKARDAKAVQRHVERQAAKQAERETKIANLRQEIAQFEIPSAISINMEDKLFYRVEEVANLFGVTSRTMYRWERDGDILPFEILGRLKGYTRDTLEKLMRNVRRG